MLASLGGTLWLLPFQRLEEVRCCRYYAVTLGDCGYSAVRGVKTEGSRGECAASERVKKVHQSIVQGRRSNVPHIGCIWLPRRSVAGVLECQSLGSDGC